MWFDLKFGVVLISHPNITHIDVKEFTNSLSRFKKYNAKKANHPKVDGGLSYDAH
jgi:hypothetical protein